MLVSLLAVLAGMALLVFSAGRFVDGASATARHFGMPVLLIGIVILGFGTSAPEMTVSVLAAIQGNPGIALGNAYGSNIANIALVLGLTAMIKPIGVSSGILRKELPILTAVTGLAVFQLWDGAISRADSLVLLACFALLMTWAVRQGLRRDRDTLGEEIEHEFVEHPVSLGRSVFWMLIGLAMLILSSRVIVWGAVDLAQSFGVSDLIIGLTILAAGTSLPELATSIIAARKGENGLALGNLLWLKPVQYPGGCWTGGSYPAHVRGSRSACQGCRVYDPTYNFIVYFRLWIQGPGTN